MSFLGSSSYLGVDIGTSSVKIVELGKDKTQTKLLTYGSIELETNIFKDDSQGVKLVVASAIKEIYKKARVRSKKAISSLPGFAVFSSLIDLPKMSQKELGEAIKYEAKRYVPISLENMVLDWKVVKEKEVSTKEGLGTSSLQVLLTAAPKALVNRYVDIFKETGLSLTGLETEAFALARSLVGNDESAVLILDIGSSATEVVVVDHKFPVLTRTLEVGGKAATEAISKSLNVSFERADQFKKDFGVKSEKQKTPEAITTVINQIVSEVKNTLSLYHGKSNRSVSKIILSGGGSWMPGIEKLISDEVNIKTYRGNPWARIIFPEALSSSLEQIGPHFAVAVGLAMREISK